MRRLSVKREQIKSLCIILTGIISVLVITLITPWLQARYESKDRKIEDEKVKIIIENEDWLKIDTNVLFNYKGVSINDKAEILKLVSSLPASNQVEAILIGNDIGQYGIHIQYKKLENDTSSNKNNIEQITFVNSTILMSLCSDLEGVITSVYIGDELQERLIYKDDLDQYFKEDVRASNKIEDFKRYSEHFLKKEEISSYIAGKHTYATSLGKEADYFFKLNFKDNKDEIVENDEYMPYMNEDMGDTLVEVYGYKLFVEGLKYDNAYINYYSAYRLLEFYNILDLEEVLVELAICKSRTKNEAVKLACNYVMDVLGNQSTQEPIWVTRFRENRFDGGRKIYMIQDGKIKKWGEWELPTAVKECTVSPDKEMVWCYGTSQNQEYAYVLPVDNEESYNLGKEEVKLQNETTIRELMSWIKGQLEKNSSIIIPEQNKIIVVDTEWFQDEFLKVHVDSNTMTTAQDLFYNPQSQILTLAVEEEFSVAQLVYELEDYLVWQGHTHILQGELGIEGLRMYVDGDYITVYEYSSMEKRLEDSQRLKKLILENAPNKKAHFLEKGRVLVVYEGKEDDMIKCLTEVLQL